MNTPAEKPWELYDLSGDPGQTKDLASRHPGKVAAMAAAFEDQARRYNVNPIGNIGDARPEIVRKVQVEFRERGGKWRYPVPVSNIAGQMAPPIMVRSYRMTARLDLPDGPVTAPIFAYGGRHGGIGFYLRQGRPVFLLTALTGDSTEVAASEALPVGSGTIELAVDRTPIAQERQADYAVTIRSGWRILAWRAVRFAMPSSFDFAEGFDIGVDQGSAMLPGVSGGVPFPGKVSGMEFDFSSAPPGAP